MLLVVMLLLYKVITLFKEFNSLLVHLINL